MYVFDFKYLKFKDKLSKLLRYYKKYCCRLISKKIKLNIAKVNTEIIVIRKIYNKLYL